MENTKGDPIELGNIFEMSVFQQEVVTALKSFGYKYVFNKYYQLEGEKLINVGAEIIKLSPRLIIFHDSNISEVFKGIENAFDPNQQYNLYRVSDTRILYALIKTT